MNRSPQKLYRPYNKTAYNFHAGRAGGDFRDFRRGKEMTRFEGTHLSIGRSQAGYDYTPLFRFLLSKVGSDWDEVFSEAIKRLDKTDPVFWLVDIHGTDGQCVVRIGESSYYSGLTVQDGILVKVDETALPPAKRCTCCTHTFNGVAY